jgi:hypothetical protein
VVEPSPTPDIVATQVAQRLTQFPTPTKAGAPQATNTLSVPLVSPTAQAATTTPSSTPAPATPSQTFTPTKVGTNTPTKTLTPIPGDPRAALGAPTWKENFQKASTWGLDTPYDDGHTRVTIAGNKIILKSYDANGWTGWRMLTNPKIENFYLEATLQVQTCSGNDTYGLIFRSPDNFKGYWLNITCDGRFSLQAGDINSSSELVMLKTSDLVKAGSNQTNRIGVMAKSSQIKLYANGKLLEEFSDQTYPSAGAFGYFIAGEKTAGFTVESPEIAYWINP